MIGHNLTAGAQKEIYTGNGKTVAYSHKTTFEIIHPLTLNVATIMEETPVDFMPNLHMVLLGVNNFLSRFVLNLDYPKQIFSIILPE